jgi:hypothetical protein
MGKDKGFRTIGDLVSALAVADCGLGSGALDLDGLEAACSDARELYERLVVLRHKAREAAASGQQRSAAVAEPLPPPPAPDLAGPETPTMRLDTRPPAVSPRQTSLIEAIEATAEPEAPGPLHAPMPETTPSTVVDKQPAPQAGPTLAEKLEKASITDLSKAISLSHKFWFIAELFGGDRITYDKSIGLINALGDREKAFAFVETEVLAKLKKPADPEALSTFMDLVERRYA